MAAMIPGVSQPEIQRQVRQQRADIDAVSELVERVDQKVDALDVKVDRRFDEISGQLSEVLRRARRSIAVIPTSTCHSGIIENTVIILGIILVVLGYALGVSNLGIIGIILLVIGAIFWSLRAISRALVSQLGTERHEDRMRAGPTNIGEPSSRSNPPY